MRYQDHSVWEPLQAALYDRSLPSKDGSAWEEILTALLKFWSKKDRFCTFFISGFNSIGIPDGGTPCNPLK